MSVGQEMCDERHHNLEEKLNKIDKKLDRILEMILGNGKLGICGKINILWGVTAFLLITIGTRLIIWVASFLPKG